MGKLKLEVGKIYVDENENLIKIIGSSKGWIDCVDNLYFDENFNPFFESGFSVERPNLVREHKPEC